MISVIVPAHNEESVIARGLRAMITGAGPDELEVIVACNGCTDRTFEIASGFGLAVRAIDVPVASKIAALNAGDSVARGEIRFYVDADVVLDLESIRRMASVLHRGDILMATPEVRMNLKNACWPVRGFYRIWTRLPYNCESGQVGTGVYALSAAGRARFECFPEVIADDGFIRFLFEDCERATVAGAVSLVDAPRTLAGLIRIKSRARLGQYQLNERIPTLRAQNKHTLWKMIRFVIVRPTLWPSAIAYQYVNYVARRNAAKLLRMSQVTWGRDDSRTPVVAD